MASFSRLSKERLATCHKDLQMLFNHVIHFYDCSIICGHRPETAQNRAFEERASTKIWPQSKHNKKPSMAVDVAPYPINWHDLNEFRVFGGIVIGVANVLHYEGFMSHRLRWGGRFKDPFDPGHFELMGIY